MSLPVVAQVFEQSPIPEGVWQRMQGKSYPAGCSVKRSDLRYLRLSHYDTEGKVRVGEMICNKSVANDLLDIFRELYDNHYVIERMQLIDDYDANDEKSMAANNTSCFCYRLMTGSKSKISKHGLGIAVDINPLYNPYVKGNYVSPRVGKKYANRRKAFPMKIDKNDLCYRLFVKHGFVWGGAWKRSQDYQHFEK